MTEANMEPAHPTPSPELFVLSVGNAYDGLTLHGPFATADDALEVAASLDQDWQIIPLHVPLQTPEN